MEYYNCSSIKFEVPLVNLLMAVYYIGSIYDSTKSYDVSFYVAGILLFISAVLHCLVPLAGRICNSHKPPVSNGTVKERFLRIFLNLNPLYPTVLF